MTDQMDTVPSWQNKAAPKQLRDRSDGSLQKITQNKTINVTPQSYGTQKKINKSFTKNVNKRGTGRKQNPKKQYYNQSLAKNQNTGAGGINQSFKQTNKQQGKMGNLSLLCLGF